VLNSVINRYKNIEFTGSNGRIDALDLYRFIAIVLMIQGHSIFAFAVPEYIDANKAGWDIWTFIRGLTAPIFMMISGAVNVFATKRLPDGTIDNKKILKRIRTAVILLFVAYVMSFPAASLRHLDTFTDEFWTIFYQTNILHITAICLLILQVFYKIAKNDKELLTYTLMFSFFALLISWFIQKYDWYAILPEILAPYLSYERGSIYTMFPVSSYFFFGVSAGIYLRNTPKNLLFEAIFSKGLKLGIALIIIGVPAFNIINGVETNYRQISLINPGGIVMRIGIVITAFPLIILLNEKIKKFSWLYLTLSKKSFFLFVIHILIIYGSAVFRGLNYVWNQNLTGWKLIASAILVELLSLSIAYYYNKTVKFLPSIRYAYLSIIIMITIMINLTY